MEFKLGELFSGPGGIAAGARNSVLEPINGKTFLIKHVWANDNHEDTCKTYKHNFPEANVIWKNVEKLKLDKLKKIDCFAYGFPCNDFSIVGESKGLDGDYGGLYRYGVNVINKFNPKFFIAENVGGLTSANGGLAMKKIIYDLQNAGKNGYDLVVHKYKFEEYGIPQARHRIIFVGTAKKLKLNYQVPDITHKKNFKTSKEALENPKITMGAYNHDVRKLSPLVEERMKLIKPGQNIWQTKLPKRLQLNVKGAKLSQIYKRLDPKRPSYTITGSGGGGTHGYHYKDPRALTNRERARLQTFQDDFEFIGKSESVRRQLGMAVSPDMAKIIFRSIFETFEKVNYPSIDANIYDSKKENHN